MRTESAVPGAGLEELLQLVEASPGVFHSEAESRIASADARGSEDRRPDDRLRLFGGQLVAQALMAACLTVPEGRVPRSLHAYFLAGPDAAKPLNFHVERVREGRSVSNRRVSAVQEGRTVFSLDASLDAGVNGFEFADAPSNGLRPEELADSTGEAAHLWSGVQMRFAETASGVGGKAAQRRLWMRVPPPLVGDEILHACALAYLSDLTLIRTALLPVESVGTGPAIRLASLDHALWFHRPVRVDQWLLYESTAPASHGGRALAIGHIFDEGGALVASVAQQGTMRALGE